MPTMVATEEDLAVAVSECRPSDPDSFAAGVRWSEALNADEPAATTYEVYQIFCADAELQAASVIWDTVTRERASGPLSREARIRILRWALDKATSEASK